MSSQVGSGCRQGGGAAGSYTPVYVPRQIRIWLRNALIAGGALGVGLFGWQAVTADALGKDRSIDVCGFVRPETIASLVPDASGPQAEVRPTKSWCEFSGWVGEGAGRAKVSLWFGYVRSTRSQGESAAQWARYTVGNGSCVNCSMKPTPVRIGDESATAALDAVAAELDPA